MFLKKSRRIVVNFLLQIALMTFRIEGSKGIYDRKLENCYKSVPLSFVEFSSIFRNVIRKFCGEIS